MGGQPPDSPRSHRPGAVSDTSDKSRVGVPTAAPAASLPGGCRAELPGKVVRTGVRPAAIGLYQSVMRPRCTGGVLITDGDDSCGLLRMVDGGTGAFAGPDLRRRLSPDGDAPARVRGSGARQWRRAAAISAETLPDRVRLERAVAVLLAPEFTASTDTTTASRRLPPGSRKLTATV